MDQTNKLARNISVKDLGKIFRKRMWIIFLTIIVSMGALFFIDQTTYVPQYSSTATLYILRQHNDSNTTDNNNSDFTLALNVVNDCTYLLKSHTVLEKVIQNLSLAMDYEELYDNVSTQNPDDTRVLSVTATADSPEEAKKIVDEICTIGSENIEAAMGFQQVNLYEYGIINPEPSNKLPFRTFPIVGCIAGILVYMIFVIAYVLDDHLDTNEEIEKTMGVSVLAEIPNANHGRKEKYGHYGKYYRAYAPYGNRGTIKKEKKKGSEKRKA